MKKDSGWFWHHVVSTAFAFGIVAIYALLAFNLKIFNPLVQVLKEYSITEFYYQVIDSKAERDTSRIVSIRSAISPSIAPRVRLVSTAASFT